MHTGLAEVESKYAAALDALKVTGEKHLEQQVKEAKAEEKAMKEQLCQKRALLTQQLTQSRQPLATSPSGDQHSPRIGSLDGHAEKSGAAACSPLPPSSSSFSGKPPRPRFLPARSRSADAALPAPLRSRALD